MVSAEAHLSNLEPERPLMSELDPKLTFDAFVVGPANRLAAAAARRAADAPGTAYNPLFLYSASGLGKSHILHALANRVQHVHSASRVRYETTEGYLDELATALSAGERDSLREDYQGLDILLLDDVQFLTGQPEAQEMLLRTIDALTASGKQIVLASDRRPGEIDGLDARLVSRFSGGLLVDIGQPEYETRVAIIRRKSEARGAALESGVAEEVARFPFRNVRELQGGLNRILAIQELEGRAVSREEVRTLLGSPSAYLADGSAEEGEGGDPDAWRKRLVELVEEAGREGFRTGRLGRILDAGVEPEDVAAVELTFRHQIDRLRQIRVELEECGHAPPEAAAGVLLDPDRIQEAEALLASAQERLRPFRDLGPGPGLKDVEGLFPPLAVRAAHQLTAEADPDYNPVLLVAGDGPYAEQLLEASGRSFLEDHPGARVGMISAEDFAEDFIRALSLGVAVAWRERWAGVDLLLFTQIQRLAETERAQDEFFNLFEVLKRRGARLFMVADRQPGGMEGIDERLRSRFESGLVVEIQDEALPSPVGAEDRDPDGPGEAWNPDTPTEPWAPTRETVIWNWPNLADLLVEDD
jgi:chromosomal replication initiator protein